jgi:hypothetical protein
MLPYSSNSNDLIPLGARECRVSNKHSAKTRLKSQSAQTTKELNIWQQTKALIV